MLQLIHALTIVLPIMKQQHMKHIMQSLQASRKLQTVGLGAHMVHHPVWANEPRFKLTVAL